MPTTAARVAYLPGTASVPVPPAPGHRIDDSNQRGRVDGPSLCFLRRLLSFYQPLALRVFPFKRILVDDDGLLERTPLHRGGRVQGHRPPHEERGCARNRPNERHYHAAMIFNLLPPRAPLVVLVLTLLVDSWVFRELDEGLRDPRPPSCGGKCRREAGGRRRRH